MPIIAETVAETELAMDGAEAVAINGGATREAEQGATEEADKDAERGGRKVWRNQGGTRIKPRKGCGKGAGTRFRKMPKMVAEESHRRGAAIER